MLVAAGGIFVFSDRIFATSTCTALSSPVTFTTDVLIDEFDATCDGFDITVGDGVTPVTVTIDGSHSFGNLTIANNGVLTHSTTGLGDNTGMRLDVSGGTIDVQDGGKIDVSLLANYDDYNSSYGGHGGSFANTIYGSIKNPDHPGSTGGNSATRVAGGFVSLIANSLNLNTSGEIRADGNSTASGGGVYINANTVSGGASSIISAYGGSGSSSGSVNVGGGGRIAVRYGTLSPSIKIIAAGGCRYSCNDGDEAGPGTIYTAKLNSGVGNPADVTDETLIVDNDDRGLYDTHAVTYGVLTVSADRAPTMIAGETDYDKLIIRNGGSLVVPDLTGVNLLDRGASTSPDLVIEDSSKLRVSNGGSLTINDATEVLTVDEDNEVYFQSGAVLDFAGTDISGNGFLVNDTSYPTVALTADFSQSSATSTFYNLASGNITLPEFTATNIASGNFVNYGTLNSTDPDVVVGPNVTLDLNAPFTSALNNVTVSGVISHEPLNTGASGGIEIEAAGTISVQDGAEINADAGGRYVNGSNSFGGKGRFGGNYGSIKNPALPGSARFGDNWGGGYISLTADTIALNSTGQITANGGTSSGSGGGINIAADVISGGASTLISANGNYNSSFDSSGGAVAGGGRIAVRYGTLSPDISLEAYGGCQVACDGDGGAGTIYTAQLNTTVASPNDVTNETLIIDNNNQLVVNDFSLFTGTVTENFNMETDIVNNDSDYDNVIISGSARVSVPSGQSLNLLDRGAGTSPDFVLTGESFFQVEGGGSFLIGDSGEDVLVRDDAIINFESGATLSFADTDITENGVLINDAAYPPVATAGDYTMTSSTAEAYNLANSSITLPEFTATNFAAGKFSSYGVLNITDSDVVVDPDVELSLNSSIDSEVVNMDIYGVVTHEPLDTGVTDGLVIEATGIINVHDDGAIEADDAGDYVDYSSSHAATTVTGTAYGSIVNPVLPGSHGLIAGFGGGVISVTADTVNLNNTGYISADSTSGGSGGSVKMLANTISGGPGTYISTEGGADNSGSSFYVGSGGRISIKSGLLSPNILVQAYGGCANACTDGEAGAGTVYTAVLNNTIDNPNDLSDEVLTIDNGGRLTYTNLRDNDDYGTLVGDDQQSSYDEIVVGNGGRMIVDTDLTATTVTVEDGGIITHTLTAVGEVDIDADSLDIQDGGKIDVSQKGNYARTNAGGYFGASHGGLGSPGSQALSYGGKFGSAYSYDGGDRITIDDNNDLDITGNISFGAWVYPTSGANFARVIDKNTNFQGGSYMAYGIFSNSTTTNYYCRMSTNGSTNVDVLSNASLPLNQWSHILCNYDGSDFKLYINGVEDNSTPATNSIVVTTGNLGIGNNPAGNNPFVGIIDEVGIWNRALTLGEISDLVATNIVPSSGNVLHLALDDAPGTTTFTDSSPLSQTAYCPGGAGCPTSTITGTSSPDTYGIATNPINPGQRGNGASTSYYGGGYMNITLAGDLNLNNTGKILANGGGSVVANTGGGSGGGMKIIVGGDILGPATAPATDDDALIQARGGDGNTISDNGGAGGGGRIYVAYSGTNNLNPLHGVASAGLDGNDGTPEDGTVIFDELRDLVPPSGYTATVGSGFQDGIETTLSDTGNNPRLKITANFATAVSSIDLSGVTLDGNANATVVSGLSSISGAGEIDGTHAIYVPNTLDAGVFICPDATVLVQVVDSCSNVVAALPGVITTASGSGSDVLAGGDTLNISLVNSSDTLVDFGTPNSYYLIEGLSGSGAGEQGSEGGTGSGGIGNQEGTVVFENGQLAFEDVPDSTTFTPITSISLDQDSFNNIGGTDAGDTVSVSDATGVNTSGFTVQLSATDFVSGTDIIDNANIYVVTTSGSGDANVSVVRSAGTGANNGVASYNVASGVTNPETILDDADTFTTYGVNLDTPVNILVTDLNSDMGTFDVNVSFYLSVPAFTPPGQYTGEFTYTLIQN